MAAVTGIGAYNAIASLVQNGSAAQASVAQTQASQTIVSETSSTSLNGQVTTTTSYADGSSRMTVSDGDIVIIRSNLHSA